MHTVDYDATARIMLIKHLSHISITMKFDIVVRITVLRPICCTTTVFAGDFAGESFEYHAKEICRRGISPHSTAENHGCIL